jgi:hypothetical protein
MNAQAATAVMVLSDDSAAYQETAEAIEHEIGGAHRVVRVLADKLAGASTDLSDAKLIFTVGVKAAEQMSGYAGKTPVLAVLVPKDWYQKSGRARLAEGGRNAGAVVLDQPYSRQLKLIKFALPSASKVGILVSQPNAGIINELEQAARQSHLSIVSAIVDSEAALIESLERILSEADVLLAVPDAVVLNRNTVQSLFITSYRYRDPVAGYSKPLSRAGALRENSSPVAGCRVCNGQNIFRSLSTAMWRGPWILRCRRNKTC